MFSNNINFEDAIDLIRSRYGYDISVLYISKDRSDTGDIIKTFNIYFEGKDPIDTSARRTREVSSNINFVDALNKIHPENSGNSE